MTIAQQVLDDAGQGLIARRNAFFTIVRAWENGSDQYLVSPVKARAGYPGLLMGSVTFKDKSALEYQAGENHPFGGQVYLL